MLFGLPHPLLGFINYFKARFFETEKIIQRRYGTQYHWNIQYVIIMKKLNAASESHVGELQAAFRALLTSMDYTVVTGCKRKDIPSGGDKTSELSVVGAKLGDDMKQETSVWVYDHNLI